MFHEQEDPIMLELEEQEKRSFDESGLSFEDQLTDEGAPSPTPSSKRRSGNLISFAAGSIKGLFGDASGTRRHSTNNVPSHVAEKLAQYLKRDDSISLERRSSSRSPPIPRLPSIDTPVSPKYSLDAAPVHPRTPTGYRSESQAGVHVERRRVTRTESSMLPPKPFIPRPQDSRARRASFAVLPITLGSLPEDNIPTTLNSAYSSSMNLRGPRRPSAHVLPPIDSPGRSPGQKSLLANQLIMREIDRSRDLRARTEASSQYRGVVLETRAQQTDRVCYFMHERGTQTDLPPTAGA